MKDLTSVKQGKATTVQDRSGKCLTEERQTLNRWTEYCSELYNYKANGDPSVLNCTQTDAEDDYPILHREVEAAVQSLKASSAVLLNSSKGDWFRTTVEVRQRCLLSPTLFNIILKRIMADALEDHEGSAFEAEQSPISALLMTSMA